jgi:hypothetical protein
MTSSFTGMLFGMIDRFHLHRLVKMVLPDQAFSKYHRPRVGFAIVLCGLLGSLSAPSYAAENLECPEIGSGALSDLIGDVTGAALITTANRVDISNEINELINRLQTNNPNISSSDVQDILIAAYCRVVANAPGLTAPEKWHRMRQFGSVLERQIAANTMPPGTLIIANVPLPPAVYRELRSQAAVSHQTRAQLMAAILTRAAGR